MQSKFMNFINVLLNKVLAIQNISLFVGLRCKRIKCYKFKARSITLSIVAT